MGYVWNHGTVCSCRSYDRQRYDRETSGGQHATDVVTSPTSSTFARQHNDETDSVATSGGMYSRYQDAITPPLGSISFHAAKWRLSWPDIWWSEYRWNRCRNCARLESKSATRWLWCSSHLRYLKRWHPSKKYGLLKNIWGYVYFSRQCFELDVIKYYWSKSFMFIIDCIMCILFCFILTNLKVNDQ